MDKYDHIIAEARQQGYQQALEDLVKEWPKEKDIDDTYDYDEKELLAAIGKPDYRTPEYLRERRYGYNEMNRTGLELIKSKQKGKV